jgi:PAS domain S-box-containing protein
MKNLKTKISLYFGLLIIGIFFLTHTLVFFNIIPLNVTLSHIGYSCFVLFLIPFILIIRGYVKQNKEVNELHSYSKRLNDVLISQSHNPLFYEGDISRGAMSLTKEVVDTLDVDRCSIWFYNDDKTSIICEWLYVKSDNNWHKDIELHKEDYKPYFLSLLISPVIIASDALTHPATSCFNESYSIPLGIKSMLDVPIIYRGDVIGVVCIETKDRRNWSESEINFAEMLSSLYSFAYSVKENNETKKLLTDFENFVDSSVLISKADKFGKITYVNKKFTEVSGWGLDEVIGKDHSIVNSGVHPKKFWQNMYKTIIKDKKIWNAVVTNKTKKGELYWVDTFITGEFNPETGELEGYLSIRQDFTDIYNTLNEINKKNSYLEYAAKIIRHDINSGINIYLPKGISSLERRLDKETIEKLKLDFPLKLLKEGLSHTQKVYKGVYDFTNLVKQDVVLLKEKVDLSKILVTFLNSTVYSTQVLIDKLPTIEVNESLFCTAIDNLIRNGLKYNDSDKKIVRIYMEGERHLIVQDNGRGMTQEEFHWLSRPYVRKKGQKETGTGLGLNICIAILKEHGFSVMCEKNNIGTKIKIKIK